MHLYAFERLSDLNILMFNVHYNTVLSTVLALELQRELWRAP